MKSRNRIRLEVEALESRWMPAVNHFVSTAGDLFITGDPVGNFLNIDLVADGVYQLTDGSGTTAPIAASRNLTASLTAPAPGQTVTFDLGGFTAGGNVTIITGAGNDAITIDLAGGTVAGALRVNAGNSVFFNSASVLGPGTVNGSAMVFTGSGPDFISISDFTQSLTFNGNLMLNSGAGDDFIDIGGFGAAPIASVGGRLFVDGGAGFDIFSIAGAVTTITGDAYISRLQSVGLNDITFSGNVTIANSSENLSNTVDVGGAVGTNISGNLTYIGGNEFDSIFLLTGSTIGGSVTVSLGNGFSGAFTFNSQTTIMGNLTILGGSGDDDLNIEGTVGGNVAIILRTALTANAFTVTNTGVIGGNLTVLGDSGDDNVRILSGAMIGGNVYANLSSAGTAGNTFVFEAGATMGGLAFTYFGGLGADSITFDGDAALARIYARTDAGDDIFTLGTTALSRLYLDLGAGDDSFTATMMLPPTLPVTLLNVENVTIP